MFARVARTYGLIKPYMTSTCRTPFASPPALPCMLRGMVGLQTNFLPNLVEIITMFSTKLYEM